MTAQAWTREDHPFDVDGTGCAAWLYRPAPPADEPSASVPCVVLAHGFGMTRACRLQPWAEAFAAAGMAALLFDYRGFGDSAGEPRQVLDIAAQRRDWAGAVAAARAAPGIDPDRVALWGTSFSGGHVLHVAARDPRIAAAVAQVPFADGRAALGGSGRGGPARAAARPAARTPGARPAARTPALTAKARRVRHTAGIVAAAIRDIRSRRDGGPPVLVPVAGEVGSGAVIAGPGAERAIRLLVPDGVEWRNEVSAGIALAVLSDRPGRDAARIRCPLFVATCVGDRVTPEGPAWAAAAAAPYGIVRRYPFDHFEAYVGPGAAELRRDETEFLVRHLRP